MDKNINLVGQGNKFEIWDEVVWGNQRIKWLDHEKAPIMKYILT